MRFVLPALLLFLCGALHAESDFNLFAQLKAAVSAEVDVLRESNDPKDRERLSQIQEAVPSLGDYDYPDTRDESLKAVLVIEAASHSEKVIAICDALARQLRPEIYAWAVWQTWRSVKDAAFEHRFQEPAVAVRALDDLRSLLHDQPLRRGEEPEDTLAHELSDFWMALVWSRAGDYQKAYEAFAAEVKRQAERGTTIIRNSRTPDAFAEDVICLHTQIFSHIKQSPELPHLGYWVFPLTLKGIKNFIFVVPSKETDVGGVAIPIKANEQRFDIYMLCAEEEGTCRTISFQQVIANRARFSVELEANRHGYYLLHSRGMRKDIRFRGPDDEIMDVSSILRENLTLHVDANGIEEMPYPSDPARPASCFRCCGQK